MRLLKILGAFLLILVVSFSMLKSTNNNFAMQLIAGKVKYSADNSWQKLNMEILKVRADMGDHIAMVNLGIILVARNVANNKKSVDLWKSAAAKGDSHALFLLGLYSFASYPGHPEPKPKEGLNYFRASAKLGFKLSACILKQLDTNGVDIKSAVRYCPS